MSCEGQIRNLVSLNPFAFIFKITQEQSLWYTISVEPVHGGQFYCSSCPNTGALINVALILNVLRNGVSLVNYSFAKPFSKFNDGKPMVCNLLSSLEGVAK